MGGVSYRTGVGPLDLLTEHVVETRRAFRVSYYMYRTLPPPALPLQLPIYQSAVPSERHLALVPRCHLPHGFGASDDWSWDATITQGWCRCTTDIISL